MVMFALAIYFRKKLPSIENPTLTSPEPSCKLIFFLQSHYVPSSYFENVILLCTMKVV